MGLHLGLMLNLLLVRNNLVILLGLSMLLHDRLLSVLTEVKLMLLGKKTARLFKILEFIIVILFFLIQIIDFIIILVILFFV